ERLVVVRPGSGDLLEELRPATGVQEVPAWLPGDVAAEVVAALTERRRHGGPGVDHVRPLLFGNRVHFDDVVAAVAQRDEHLDDEVDLVAVAAGSVAGRRVGSTGEEEVRKAAGLDAEERLGTIRPVVLERETMPTTDPHARERTRAEIEAGRPHDDVELAQTFGSLDARLAHTSDRRLPEIDERDVRPVVRLVVAGHEGRPFLSEPVVLRDQLL